MCKLPRKMLPSKAAFEALGFTFLPSEEDTLHYQANLPEGWKAELSNPVDHINIVDFEGSNRVIYDYKNAKMVLQA